MDDASTSAGTPARYIPERRTAVPRSFVAAYRGRSDMSTPIPTGAAWCQAAPRRVGAGAAAAGAWTWPVTTGTPGSVAGPRSSTGRAYPEATRAAVTWVTLKPDPPVTSTVLIGPESRAAGRRGKA